MIYIRFCFLLGFFFLSCSTFSSRNQKSISVLDGKPLPELRLVPVKPSTFPKDAEPDEMGCYYYKAENIPAQSSRARINPEQILKIADSFIKREYGNRAPTLTIHYIARYKSIDSVSIEAAPTDSASFDGIHSTLDIGDNEVTSASLCVYDYFLEKESDQYCSADKAIDLWTKKMNSLKSRKKKSYSEVSVLHRYFPTRRSGALIMTPFWWIYEFNADKSDVYINQLTCEVKEGD